MSNYYYNPIKLSLRMIQLASIYVQENNFIEAILVLRSTKNDLSAIENENITELRPEIQ